MAREFSRTDRVAGMLARQLALLIQKEMNDPRVSLLTITGVDVTRDLEHAKVYFTLHNPAEKDQVCKVLNNAKSFLKYQLAQTKTLRMMPTLDFIYDDSLERADKMNELINNAVRKHDDGES